MAGPRPPGVARRILRAYPATWRHRYAAEVAALLEDRPPGWRDVVDLARGALDAHLHPAVPSRFLAWAALLAGACWAVVAMGVLLEPAPPDWPGYLAWVLPPAAIGGLAGLVASLGLGLRLGSATGRIGPLGWAPIGLATVGQAAFVVALIIAALGGPYGAITGAATSLAAVGLVAQGLVTLRAGRGEEGIGLTVIGAAFLLPPPLAWVAVAAAWTALAAWLAVDRASHAAGPVGPGIA